MIGLKSDKGRNLSPLVKTNGKLLHKTRKGDLEGITEFQRGFFWTHFNMKVSSIFE